MSTNPGGAGELQAQVDELRREVARLRRAQPRHVEGGSRSRLGRRGGLGFALGLIGLLAMAPALVLGTVTFGDVPPTNPFYADIQALAASGVTSGCGDGNFCPEGYVTREQMAAFMNRLGALAAGKTPVVNAAELGGVPASGFYRYGATLPAGASLTGNFAFSDTGEPGSDVTGEDAISFEIPLASAPAVHLINRGDPLPPGCSGSITAPSAAAGNLCVFVAFSSESDALDGYYSVTSGFQGLSSNRGVVVYLHDANADGFVEGAGTWAVHAGGTATPLAPEPPGGTKGAGQRSTTGS